MAGWNGSGTFSVTYNWVQDKNNNIVITASRMDTQFADVVSGLNNCVTLDGQNTATANLPMGGFKHTNVADATSGNEYATLGQLQDKSGTFVTTAGSANAYTASLSPAITAYSAGQEFTVIINVTNTGASTININNLGDKDIYYNGAALTGNELIINRSYELTYDGTQFNITSPISVEYTQGQAILASQVYS